MIVPLPEGQSATLRDSLTYAQARDVRVAYLQARTDPVAQADVDMALVRAFLESWTLSTPATTPEDAPDTIVQVIAQQAAELYVNAYKDRGAPKAGAGTSRSTRRARQ